MSLLRFIHHTPVGSPTYLDLLPADVIGHHILPFLGWEDRIHVNMLTPPGDRTPPNKIPKDRIVAHQMLLSALTTTHKIKLWNHLANARVSAVQKNDALIDVLQAFSNGHTPLILMHSRKLRDMVEQKTLEFSNPENIKKVRLLRQRAEMSATVQKLVECLATNPYSHEISARKWLDAWATQTEVSLVHVEWREGGSVVRRRQGDIYTVWE